MGNKKDIFKNLYMTYSPSLYVYARRFVENAQVREDIVCDVFARLWQKGEDFILKEETALAFLKTSVRNACLNHIRALNSADNFATFHIGIPSYADSPEAIYTLDEMYSMLYAAVEKLSPAEKAIFHESFMMEKKQADIARNLGVSIKTVERYRKRILDFLKHELKDNLPVIAFLTLLSV
jgi:RNA polymerase sigma-70 factor (ECF subfamily)